MDPDPIRGGTEPGIRVMPSLIKGWNLDPTLEYQLDPDPIIGGTEPWIRVLLTLLRAGIWIRSYNGSGSDQRRDGARDPGSACAHVGWNLDPTLEYELDPDPIIQWIRIRS